MKLLLEEERFDNYVEPLDESDEPYSSMKEIKEFILDSAKEDIFK